MAADPSAGPVETIPDVSVLSGEEHGTTRANLETSNREQKQAISDEPPDENWSGSLPVTVPSSNQAGPGLHHVESSTTDSGVSNASSVTSDSVPPLASTTTGEGGPLTPTQLRLGLREVEEALGDFNKGVRGVSMSSEPEYEEKEGGADLSKLGKGVREGEYNHISGFPSRVVSFSVPSGETARL